MTPRYTIQPTDPASKDPRTLLLILFTLLVGSTFFIQYQLEYTPPEMAGIILLVGLTLCVPAIMSYTGYSLMESVVIGMVPWLGAQVGGWFDLPISLVNIENILNVFILSAGLALPVVTASYIVGIGLRDREVVLNQSRALGVRLVIAMLVALAVYGAANMGYISAGIDQ